MSFLLMSYTRLAKKPLIFRSFTGVTISEFDFIYNELESKYDDHERARHFSKMNNRQRNMGAGRPFKLKEYNTGQQWKSI